MVVRVSKSSNWSADPGMSLGLLAYVMAAISFLVQTKFRLGYSSFESFIAPALPWVLSMALLVAYRKRPLRFYWWVIPSILLANPYAASH